MGKKSEVMHKRLLMAAVALLMAAVVWAADGPLTPLMQLRARTDGNGYLLVSGGTYGGADGPLTPLANLRGRTDQNGYLRVALAGGVVSSQLLAPDGACGTTPSYSFSSDTDTGFYWGGSGTIIVCANGTRPISFSGNVGLGADGVVFWTNTAGNATATPDSFIARNGAAGRLVAYGSSASVGVELAIGGAVPTLTSCGTGTVTAKSTNIAGEVTATGATSCTVNFATPVFSNQPFCIIEEETTAVAHRISAISTTAFTVTGLTSGDKFMYVCLGGK